MKQTIKFKKRYGSVIKKEDANKVGNTLISIMEKNGRLNPNLVLEEAKKKSSVLHNYFEWDNNVAAEKYRLQQARNIVEAIVEEVVIEGKKTEQRSFHSVNIESEKIYVTLNDAISVPDYRIQLLSKIINHLENTTQLMKMFQSYK